MPPKRRIPASRISKNKANATLRRIIAPTVRQRDLIDPPVLPIDPNHIQNPNSAPRIPGQAEEIPRIDIALLNTLITRLEGYETGLDAVKTTIWDLPTKVLESPICKTCRILGCFIGRTVQDGSSLVHDS